MMEQVIQQKVFSILKGVSIFKDSDDDVISNIARSLTFEEYEKAVTIFHKDEIGDAMFIIQSGAVKVHDGDYIFSILQEDDVFGEYYLVDSRRRSLSVTTIEPTKLLRIDQNTFYQLMAGNIQITRGILQASVRRLRNMNNIEAELAARNKEIEEQKLQLAELNATKDRFFSIIAHDLRGPLGSIVSFFELLNSAIDQLDNHEVVDLVKSIHQSSDQLMKLLENLLQWSRMQTGQLTSKSEKFNLCTLINDNIELLQPNADRKQIILQNHDCSELSVYADKNMIGTVLRNLLGNAIKFTPDGGKISIYTIKEYGQVKVRICDTGTGIREEDLPRLFRIDIKHTTEGTNKEKGTGLGLSLCKEFVEKNGGKIHVESTFGKGSMFEFSIPAVK